MARITSCGLMRCFTRFLCYLVTSIIVFLALAEYRIRYSTTTTGVSFSPVLAIFACDARPSGPCLDMRLTDDDDRR